MLVVLKCLEKLVVLGERLGSPVLGHVERPVLQLLPPKGYGLLLIIPEITVE